MDADAALSAGERVLLVDLRGRRYLVTLEDGGRFHSHLGIVEHEDVIGRPAGSLVSTSKGSKLLVFRPTFADFVLKMPRGAQLVYPKDLGLIVVYADIFPGATVLEAGSGSGSLTLGLARAAGPSGRILSYELREDHHERARTNVDSWLSAHPEAIAQIDLKLGDVFADVEEQSVDRMVLDLPEPWRAVGTATEALAAGGILCCYLPTIPQVAQTVEAMRRGGFSLVETFEALLRTWNVDGMSVRPDHRMVAHTGFIVTGRKTVSREG